MPDRHLDWDGCCNVRDLGGLPTVDGATTAWGAIVRSDNPAHLTPAGWRALLAHGVRTVIALRTTGSADDEPDPALVPAGVTVQRVTVEDGTDPRFVAECVDTMRFATPISLVIPVVTGVMTRTIPAMRDDRVLYAVYESAMTVLVLALAHRRFGRRAVDEASIRWIREVSYLFAGLYAGWAACDMLILAGFDFAHVLRIVPNVAYYGAFLPFVLWRAPASWKDVRTAG